MDRRRVLLTGGAGYIGSHTCLVLLEQGHDVVVVDDLSNSSEESIRRVRVLSQVAEGAALPVGQVSFHHVDLRDTEALDAVLTAEPVDSVIHFAGLKAVGESAQKPLEYYDVNLGGTFSLLQVLERHEVRDVVFSSSATVYGEPEFVPLTEQARLSGTNPYARTKLFIEELLRDVAAADPSWRIALLRYFNPVGSHPSGRIGEDPSGIPNNLMPFIMQVAVGRRPQLVVFGNDYATRDGTCIRDYIHVMDLAEGHLAALRSIGQIDGCRAVNLGTGQGQTVLEVLHAASQAAGFEIPYTIGARRPGDAAESYADTTLAADLLDWRATRSLSDMCDDAWRWQSSNPNGYGA